MPVPKITNGLLEILPEQERSAVFLNCVLVSLVFDETLVNAGDNYPYVYFPLGAIISMVSIINGESSLEAGLLGDEGMLGATVALGVDTAPTLALVQGSGTALRMETRVFKQLLDTLPVMQQMIMRYLFVTSEQLAQASVCTRFHILESRLARWLMMARDRAHVDTFSITHQYLASILGVRRVGVTEAASRMQQRGLIHYRRGSLHIVDSHGLESVACSCYKSNKQIYERIMNA